MTRYVEDTYSKIAQIYADAFFNDTRDLPFIKQLAARLKPGDRVLDLGCGPGQFSKWLSEQGFAVEGIDNSPEMLAIARSKVPAVSFRQMDMRQLDFADHSFHAVLSAYSIIHIPSSELPGVLLEIRRVLKPGGLALFITQQGEPDRVVDDPLLEGTKVFVNFFAKNRLNQFLSDADFKMVAQGTGKEATAEVLSGTVIWTLVSPQPNRS
jgi:ubiquinone/menaquinone biosynthesis C-methylase UbiE